MTFTGHQSFILSDCLQVKVDLLTLAQQCVPDLDLQAELERSFLSEPTSPVHRNPIKGFRLGKHKHETFITSRYIQKLLTLDLKTGKTWNLDFSLYKIRSPVQASWIVSITALHTYLQSASSIVLFVFK